MQANNKPKSKTNQGKKGGGKKTSAKKYSLNSLQFLEKKGYGKGTFLETRYFLSPAFRSLGEKRTAPTVSTASIKILILLLAKRRFTKQKNKSSQYVRADDNKFPMTYKELEAYGISQGTATRAFDELLAKGFIDIAHQGGAFDKDKSLYSLVDDFRGWRPGDPPIRTRPKDVVRRGYQGENKNNVR